MSGFNRGEVIVCSEPYAHALGTEYRGLRCDHCFKKSDDLKRCSQCSFVYFCDKNCQTRGWGLHKLECKYIMSAKQKPLASIRLISLVLLKVKKYGMDNPFEEVLGRKMSFGTLMSHSKNIIKSKMSYQLMLTLMHEISRYIGPANVPDPEEFAETFGRMRVNGFSIADDNDSEVVGCGVYLGAAVFDHSCEPNAEVVFDGVTLYVRANQDIPQRDINHVFVSYISQLQLSHNRQRTLKELYYFRCQCIRCTSPLYDDKMIEMLIDEKEAEEELRKTKERLKKLEKMMDQHANLSAIEEECRKEIEIQNNVLGSTNIYRIKTLEIAFNVCIKLKKWIDAISFGKLLTEPYRFIYGPYSRHLGIHLFKIGKILLYYGSVTEAEDVLTQTEEIMKVTHGDQHFLYQDLLKLLAQFQK
ncbi:histone-lysine N-methyltransferase SMYD3 [Nephila pilipes]|uniref:Histone-lysine N-methyltransferase SMYD3 n=1 Tax=Nephila pilipes TaxID=299642 RepID=A0A8X6Q5F9_NEPPI|nr:histone-lysine N-methyltransferase SMYD3 [Nephila pilipes]